MFPRFRRLHFARTGGVLQEVAQLLLPVLNDGALHHPALVRLLQLRTPPAAPLHPPAVLRQRHEHRALHMGVWQDSSRISALCTPDGKKKANLKYTVMVHRNYVKGGLRRKKQTTNKQKNQH